MNITKNQILKNIVIQTGLLAWNSFRRPVTQFSTHLLLKIMAANFNYRPNLNRYLLTQDGFLNFTIGFKTENGKRSKNVTQSICFKDGHVTVFDYVPDVTDACLIFKDETIIWEMIRQPPAEVLNLLLKNKIKTTGNMNYLSLFNFLLSLLLFRKHRKILLAQQDQLKKDRQKQDVDLPDSARPCLGNRSVFLESKKSDSVTFLDDPYLGEFGLNDFPRLKQMLAIHFNHPPQICIERPLLLTRWYRKNGFEKKKDNTPWNPVVRQGLCLRYLMENKQPIIRSNDLLAGATTTKQIGVVLYPDAHAGLLWGELQTLGDRMLNPYQITSQEIDTLHFEILPYWIDRNFREWVRKNHQAPSSQQLDERFAVYFHWKTVAISHTIANFSRLLQKGAQGIIEEIQVQLKSPGKYNTDFKHGTDQLNAMTGCLQGMIAYAQNLSVTARQKAAKTSNQKRKKELLRMARLCANVPQKPAQTLDEAIQSIWIAWITLHMENTNAGLSFGRLDQLLMPYFAADMQKLKSPGAKKKYITHALELLGGLFIKATDHLPMIPDIGNYLFGGSSSDQAITLGGVTPQGENAVNDMTFLLLKVTEMLKLRDPNVNARFYDGINSDQYLTRLCEVNLNTTATPSIHGDRAVIESIQTFSSRLEDIRDWSATGCVEPTLSGKHFGHTGCVMFNLVAGLEMALNQGYHPLINQNVGPKTQSIENMTSFEQFWLAYTRQIEFLIDQIVEYNYLLAQAHSMIRPTPLLSSLIDGCIQNKRDVTRGGATYNTTGTACIGLSDVVDSLLTIQKLVFTDHLISFSELKQAIDRNFENDPQLHARILKSVPKFGSRHALAIELANQVSGHVNACFARKKNFRNGFYTTGFWSMSNHVAFGNLTGALPSGRLAGKPFTPGLTPCAAASKNLLDNLHDVSALDCKNITNNMAFNVKYVPNATDSHLKTVSNMTAYAKTFFQLGGMQMQLNVVSGAILKHAMAHPELYQDLLVRISGYNAYFVTLNADMQKELIERAEFR